MKNVSVNIPNAIIDYEIEKKKKKKKKKRWIIYCEKCIIQFNVIITN